MREESIELTFFLNGKFVKASHAVVSVFDHGFLFGDRILKYLRIHQRRIFRFEESYEQFHAEAERLGLTIPMGARGIYKTVEILLEQNQMDDSLALLILTRGEGPITFNPELCSSPVFAILMFERPEMPGSLYNKGVSIVTSPYRQTPSVCGEGFIYIADGLQNVMSSVHAGKQGVFDTIYLNLEGYATRCASSYLFAVKDEQVKTPDENCGVTPSVVRNAVLDLAKQNGLMSYESLLTYEDLIQADEVFLASIHTDVIPVIRIDNHTVGSGRPGSATRFIHRCLADSMAEG